MVVGTAIEHYILSRLSDKSETKYGKTYFVNVVFSWKGYDIGSRSPGKAVKEIMDQFGLQIAYQTLPDFGVHNSRRASSKIHRG